MHVIGTAGHVDHGKSSLVKALSGIDPDRLREEQTRQMTIELGFAWLNLPNGNEIGIIDVPGHKDFIDNMLSGVGGIDAVMLIIAVDEGVMPQTREHLAIIDLLKIQRGVVVLTKADLAPDEEWIQLLTLEAREFLVGTVLENAPIVPFSVNNESRKNELLKTLEILCAELPERRDIGKPRLWIDRVFTISGFGTVVTGTLQDGTLRIGDELELMPTGIKTRVRGLQTHKKDEQFAIPGSRVAVNLSGIKTEQIQRGIMLALPGTYRSTRRIDVQIEMVADASEAISHDDVLRFHLGSSQSNARVRVIGSEKVLPGQKGWAQLEFEHPIPLNVGDRFILRRPSPGATLAGGRILVSNPKRRHRRFHPDVINNFEQLDRGLPEDQMMQALADSPLDKTQFRSLFNMNELEFKDVSASMISRQRLVLLSDRTNDYLATSEWINRYVKKSIDALSTYHLRYPLRIGIPREELKNKLGLQNKLFPAFWEYLASEKSKFRQTNDKIALVDFKPKFTDSQSKYIDSLMTDFNHKPYSPPSVRDCVTQIGEEPYHALIANGSLVQVADDVVFLKDTYEKMKSVILSNLTNKKAITLAEVRDLFGTSRKYAVAMLEHLDTIGATVREGDIRHLAD